MRLVKFWGRVQILFRNETDDINNKGTKEHEELSANRFIFPKNQSIELVPFCSFGTCKKIK